MDHFIQYLFYFIIIVSFLNSIFGKKRKQETKPVPEEPAPDPFRREVKYPDNESSTLGEDNFAIMKEIENLFNKDMKTEALPAVKFKTLEEAVVGAKIDYTDERAKEFERQLSIRAYDSSWFSKNIRAKLRNPESLKDYIIISEILGKPKAFE